MPNLEEQIVSVLARKSYQPLKPKALAELLSKTLPELKCSVKAQSVVLEGSLEDLVQAQEVARGADATGVGPMVTRIYTLKYVNPKTNAK